MSDKKFFLENATKSYPYEKLLQYFVTFDLVMYLVSLYRCFISGIYALTHFSVSLKVKITENSVISFPILWIFFNWKNIIYTCLPIPDLFGYWEVYLIGLLMQFKSSVLVTLSKIEGSLSIVISIFYPCWKYLQPNNSCSQVSRCKKIGLIL